MVTSDRLLRRALLAQLRQAPEFVLPECGNTDDPEATDVVVSTTSDCPEGRVAEFTKDGVSVVVLAAIPRNDECRRYRSAGASAYIPMTADGVSLLKEIREAVS
ncbi:MAG: hypothetical protein IT303_20465 [Dehalococcoidia bacterium]|nr:hypothetical protein [Dehalococcoidia bacterium]